VQAQCNQISWRVRLVFASVIRGRVLRSNAVCCCAGRCRPSFAVQPRAETDQVLDSEDSMALGVLLSVAHGVLHGGGGC
jgi:hypothetical protein